MSSNSFTTWRKATYSVGNGNCVEVAADRRIVGIRDTAQHGHGWVLEFSTAAWHAFIEEAKSLLA
jgi:hypothetical protein